jgi:RHS repeat-associated protein
VPNNNPSGAGAFEFNLRFPGQYFDWETGLFYNVNRDYWPDGGRYVESDPIGIRAGLNTYLYVNGDPLGSTDPLGLMGYGGGGSANPGRPMTPTPITPTPAPSCDGRWVFIRMTRDFMSQFSLNCTCWWSCYSCPGGPGDAFPDPNLGQYPTPGKLTFTENYGKDYSPKKGDRCFPCDKPGPEKGCCGGSK